MEGRILLVEDEKNIAKLVKYNLEKAGFECDIAVSGEKALEYLDNSAFDAVILDIMLPKMNGFEVCRTIRADERFTSIPVLMLTAKGEEVDRVVGFELGADDYIIKPFSPRELVLRLKAVLKRRKPEEPAPEILQVDDLKINMPKHTVSVAKKKITLTLMEFNLLVTLIKRRGRVQSREQLLDDVWAIDSEVTTRTIDTHIKRLRQKLGKKIGKMIETVRGIGYRFSEAGD
ncbi:MAG: response regulator transcription factor [Candidatus Omnitrophota bacterium]